MGDGSGGPGLPAHRVLPLNVTFGHTEPFAMRPHGSQ
jgi:hypothetical protein